METSAELLELLFDEELSLDELLDEELSELLEELFDDELSLDELEELSDDRLYDEDLLDDRDDPDRDMLYA